MRILPLSVSFILSSYMIMVGMYVGSGGPDLINIAAAAIVYPIMLWSINGVIREVLK